MTPFVTVSVTVGRQGALGPNNRKAPQPPKRLRGLLFHSVPEAGVEPACP